eukprot:GHVN01003425.1.p1 GENE.GHVN01003425.1~~GHVN01003425.1.p1  ORF type:complete len:137 (-),score=12.89 GHVN01003425.1:179-589(-)
MEMNQRRLAQEAEYAAQGMSDESECKKYGHTFMLECLALYQCEECNRGFQHWTGLQGHLATAQRHSDDAAERNRANQLKGIQRNTGRHANKQVKPIKYGPEWDQHAPPRATAESRETIAYTRKAKEHHKTQQRKEA